MPPESSPEISNDAVASQENQDVNKPAAEPSAADTGVEKSFFDTVNDALKGSEAAPPSEVQKSDPSKAEPEKSNEDAKLTDDVLEEELNQYPQKTQRRIRQLLDQRGELRTERDQLTPKAQQWDRVQDYMRQHNIEPQEFDNALHITRLINSGDYPAALKLVAPIFRDLANKAGEVLPAELQQQVDLGHLTEAHARELHRSRTEAALATDREKQGQERAAQERQQRELQQVINVSTTAADDWAKAKAKSDPDWHLKQNLVAKEVELKLHRLGVQGYPRTPKAVIELVEEALKDVEAHFKTLAPKPSARNPVNGQYASSTSKPKPETFMDAVNQALESTR